MEHGRGQRRVGGCSRHRQLYICNGYSCQEPIAEALGAFLSQVTVRPLYAHVAKHNLASIRVLEKCGFTRVGEDKQFSNVGGKVVEGLILKRT